MTDTERAQAFARARAVKQAWEEDLMRKANVVGVGVGLRRRAGRRTDEVVLVVMVERKVPEAQLSPEDVIPSHIEGVPLDVQEVGRLAAHGE